MIKFKILFNIFTYLRRNNFLKKFLLVFFITVIENFNEIDSLFLNKDYIYIYIDLVEIFLYDIVCCYLTYFDIFNSIYLFNVCKKKMFYQWKSMMNCLNKLIFENNEIVFYLFFLQ